MREIESESGETHKASPAIGRRECFLPDLFNKSICCSKSIYKVRVGLLFPARILFLDEKNLDSSFLLSLNTDT